MMPRTGGSPRPGSKVHRRWKYYNGPGTGFTVIITTDHGTINVQRPAKVLSKELTTNLRYKNGNGMSYSSKHSFVIKNPESVGLLKQHIADEYIFALTDYFMCTPTGSIILPSITATHISTVGYL